jgi:hypothetical protein
VSEFYSTTTKIAEKAAWLTSKGLPLNTTVGYHRQRNHQSDPGRAGADDKHDKSGYHQPHRTPIASSTARLPR